MRSPAICVVTSPPRDLKASSSLRTTNLSDKSVTDHGPYAPKQSLITGCCCFPMRYLVSLSWAVMHDSPLDNHPSPIAYGSAQPVHQPPPLHLFACSRGVNVCPLWVSLLGTEILSDGTGHKMVAVASPQQLDPKGHIHPFLLTGPGERPGPCPFHVLVTHSHHMIYPVPFHNNVIFFFFCQTLPVLVVAPYKLQNN